MEKLEERIKSLFSEGKSKSENEEVSLVELTWCPICDKTKWDLWDKDFEYIERGDDLMKCYVKEHSKFFISQSFSSTCHTEYRDLYTLLKYFKAVKMKEEE